MPRKRIVIIVGAISVLICMLYIVYRPRQFHYEMYATTMDGETVHVTLDLVLRRTWDLATRVHGTMTFDGIEYASEWDTVVAFRSTWGQQRHTKHRPSPQDVQFFPVNFESPIWDNSESWFIYMETVSRSILRMSTGNFYSFMFFDYSRDISASQGGAYSIPIFYAPATNIEEARRILEIFILNQ